VEFGLGHIEQGYDAVLLTGILGIVWGFIYLVRGSIVTPMVSHSGFNLAQLLAYLAFATR
jgi:membrane protease YdiL (CAAX protease family)